MHAGQTAFYPPVEMIFNPVLNQLDYQLSPGRNSAANSLAR